MRGYINTKRGEIFLNEDVIAKYAGSIAVECFGIVGMAMVSISDGLVKLLQGEKLTYGIKVTISKENKVTLEFHVIIAYGVNIPTVAMNLMETVKYSVEEFCSMEVENINIYVEGVRKID